VLLLSRSVDSASASARAFDRRNELPADRTTAPGTLVEMQARGDHVVIAAFRADETGTVILIYSRP
jgi:hypothetical protein